MDTDFQQGQLGGPRPSSIRPVQLPRRAQYTPTPVDWRNEIIYFLLPDRFSDGREGSRKSFASVQLPNTRPADFRFDNWAESGDTRWQGGTLAGVASKIDYLQNLGITTIWLGPIFKQRRHLNTYHGYAIQDFLEVDPRLGTRADLVALVSAAHAAGLHVILDVIFNHTGTNWFYDGLGPNDANPPYLPWPGHYQRGDWLTGAGGMAAAIAGPDDGVWPAEMQPEAVYTRAGEGSLGSGSLDDPHAEFRRSDFIALRDVNFDDPTALDILLRCYKYWIALTDCDGFRIDTLKHVDAETGRNFCGGIKEFAANLGKASFFLVGEVAGGDDTAQRYQEMFGTNLDATLDIGWSRQLLHQVAKGLASPSDYFAFVRSWNDDLGSHRNAGRHHVSILDDHDHVSGDKVRFSADASSDHQVVAGVAIQLFSLGVPCIYYGSEQAFAGPEKELRAFLPGYNNGAPTTDRYLREAMFGPEHPRKAGTDGIGPASEALDPALPGFGPFGTCGVHAFEPGSPTYTRIAHLADVRQRFPVLRGGRLYARPISVLGGAFGDAAAGELIAWSRILDEEEALCIVNGHGTAVRGADIVVDALLNAPDAAGAPWDAAGPAFVVVANSAQAAQMAANPGVPYAGSHPVGERLPVQARNGCRFVAVLDVGPSEVIVLLNRK